MIKKTFLLFLTAALSFSFFCCKKNDAHNAVEEKALLEDQEPVLPQPAETLVGALVLSERAGLFLLGRDEKMHSVKTLLNGAGLDAVLLDGLTEEKEIEGKKFFHVVYDNVDFWAQEKNICLSARRAVLVESAALFNDKDLTERALLDLGRLKFGTIVGLVDGTEKSLEEGAQGGAEKKAAGIYYYGKKSGQINFAFVDAQSVSDRIDDIEVSRIALELGVTRRESRRTVLWAEAEKYNPCPKVRAALEEQKIERQSYNYDEVVKSLKKVGRGVNIDELMTVDQSKDPFKK